MSDEALLCGRKAGIKSYVHQYSVKSATFFPGRHVRSAGSRLASSSKKKKTLQKGLQVTEGNDEKEQQQGHRLFFANAAPMETFLGSAEVVRGVPEK